MTKTVRMVAEVLLDKCTGCALCVYVCPTVALSLRTRTGDDPVGPGTRRVAELVETDCYNAQNCLEICPEEAIVMHELAEPFVVGVDRNSVDGETVARLCAAAGMHPKQPICLCAEVNAGEIAAAIQLGASTPEDVSLMTGARTGCTEICVQPILELLRAAGHADPPRNPPRGFQWYGLAATGFDLLDDSKRVRPEIVEAFSHYRIESDLQAMMGNFDDV